MRRTSLPPSQGVVRDFLGGRMTAEVLMKRGIGTLLRRSALVPAILLSGCLLFPKQHDINQLSFGDLERSLKELRVKGGDGAKGIGTPLIRIPDEAVPGQALEYSTWRLVVSRGADGSLIHFVELFLNYNLRSNVPVNYRMLRLEGPGRAEVVHRYTNTPPSGAMTWHRQDATVKVHGHPAGLPLAFWISGSGAEVRVEIPGWVVRAAEARVR